MVETKKACKSMIFYKPFDAFATIKVGMTGRLYIFQLISKSMCYKISLMITH